MKIIPNETTEQGIVSVAWGFITGCSVWLADGPLWSVVMAFMICFSVVYIGYAALNLLRGL